MVDASQITEHMEVVGSDGEHVGTVDCLDGDDKIKLTKSDPGSGGEHHIIPLDWATSIEEDCVVLSKPASEVMRSWQPAM